MPHRIIIHDVLPTIPPNLRVHRQASTVHRQPSPVHRQPSTVHRQPLTVYRQPLAVHRDQRKNHLEWRTVLRESPTVHRVSPTVHRESFGVPRESSKRGKLKHGKRRLAPALSPLAEMSLSTVRIIVLARSLAKRSPSFHPSTSLMWQGLAELPRCMV